MNGNEQNLWRELARPFEPQAISLKVQAVSKDRSKGLIVPYIDARSVMDRLDQVVGVEGWSDGYERVADGALKCRLSILGISKEDVGLGDDMKAACSDALKRAGVKFGIGRHLYESNNVWAPLDERGGIQDEERVKARVLGTPPPNGAPPSRNGSQRVTTRRPATQDKRAGLPFDGGRL